MIMNAQAITHAAHGAAPTFAQLWSPGFLLAMVVLGVLYTLATGPWRSRFAESEPVGLKPRLWFWGGLALWYIAEGSPLSYYGHHEFFSLHMLQQAVLYLVMPPFLLLGTPGWLLRPLFRTKGGERFMKVFANPMLSLFLFNFIFSLYHIPIVMDWLMVHEAALRLYYVIFLTAAFQMWFPVFCPMPEYAKISELKKMLYIFVNGILLTPACALIIFAKDPLYASYAHIPATIWFLESVDDQQLGGVVMKIVQEIVYGFALAYVFFRWYRSERQKEEEEDLLSDSMMHSTGNAH